MIIVSKESLQLNCCFVGECRRVRGRRFTLSALKSPVNVRRSGVCLLHCLRILRITFQFTCISYTCTPVCSEHGRVATLEAHFASRCGCTNLIYRTHYLILLVSVRNC